MYALAERSGYRYQHIWNYAKGRTAGSDEFREAMEKAIGEIKAERKSKPKKS